MDEDRNHLQLLSVFHYILGGITAFFACFPAIHLVMGLMMVLRPEIFGPNANNQPPAFMGWFFVFMGGLFILGGWALAICMIFAGRFLARRRKYIFCMVIAAIECIFMPFGTVLGVFTIIILQKDTVKGLFEENKVKG